MSNTAMTMEPYVRSLRVGDPVMLCDGQQAQVRERDDSMTPVRLTWGSGMNEHTLWYLVTGAPLKPGTGPDIQLPIRGEHRERWLALVAKRKARKVPGVFNVGDRVRVISTQWCFANRMMGLSGVIYKAETMGHSGHRTRLWVKFDDSDRDDGVDRELEHV